MYPIFARTEFGFIYSFALIWWLTILGSVTYLRWHTGHWRWFDRFLVGLMGAVILGRFQFIYFNQAYFTENSQAVWQVFTGGLGYHGALWGGIAGAAVYSLIKRQNRLLPFLSLIAPLVAVWHTAGWLACWLEGCAYGRTAFIGWATAVLPDSYGVWEVRYQTQLAGVLLSAIVVFWWWRWGRKILNAKNRLWLDLFMMQVIYLLLTFWRGDDVPLWYSWRADIWLSLLTILGTLVTYFLLTYQRK